MKVTVNVECTPEEARAFLGLPNVAPINDAFVNAMKERVEANIDAVKPEQLMKNWYSMGGMMTDQMLGIMTAAASGVAKGSKGADDE